MTRSGKKLPVKQATRLYDLRELTPADFPGHRLSAPVVGDRLGFARPLWRVLSWRCGDVFADWCVETCAQYVDPWTQLKACVAVAEAGESFGAGVRAKVAELLAPYAPPEEGSEGLKLGTLFRSEEP